MNLALGCLALALQVAPPADWWNGDWKHRRAVTVKNNLDGRLEAGYPIAILIDAGYLGLDEKAKDGLADLVVTHAGKEAPFALGPGPSKGTYLLWIRTATPLEAGASDKTYRIYYGNSAAEPRAGSLSALFDFHEDFESPRSIKSRFEMDGDLTWTVRDRSLIVRDVSEGRTRLAPARLLLKALPKTAGFAISFDLEIDAPEGAVLACDLNVDLKQPPEKDRDLRKRVAELIENLGALDFEAREKATEELLKLGKAAVPLLVLATRSKDPEVKWRAEHLLRRIEKKTAPPRMSAGIRIGDDAANPVGAWYAIHRTSARFLVPDLDAGKVRIEIMRDQDGDVTMLWNNRAPQTGSLPGEIERIYFSIYKGVAGPMGTIRIDNVSIRRYVDADSRPTYTVDVEESRP